MTTITKDEAQERIEGVLKSAGITVYLGTCGCDTAFDVEFPDGAQYSSVGEGFEIECDGITHQRGG